MKRHVQQLALVSWLLIRAGFLFAQAPAPDVLHKLDQTTQNVRVKEVTDIEVFYTDLNAPATVRKIRKADLWKVVFGDGTSDVFNEPKANPTAASTPPPGQAVATRPQKSPKSARPARVPRERVVRSAPVSNSPAADIGVFGAGGRALSFGPGVSGSSTTRKTATTTSSQAQNTIGLSVLYQKFVRDNVSVGGGIRLSLLSETTRTAQNTDTDSSPFIAFSGQTRRYLPIADQVAFYGFGSAEVGFASYKNTFAGKSETIANSQQLILNAGGGLAYVFGGGWSVDFNAALLGLTLYRDKAKSPTSKADVDFSITGAGVVPSFSIFLTRYF